MSAPYTLATTGEAAADREFFTLAALARHIVAARGAAPPDAKGEPPEITLTSANVARGGLPAGMCVAVRMLDGAGPRGSLIGYAFMPPGPLTSRLEISPARMLMAAILTVARAPEERRAA